MKKCVIKYIQICIIFSMYFEIINVNTHVFNCSIKWKLKERVLLRHLLVTHLKLMKILISEQCKKLFGILNIKKMLYLDF